jgi:hypothetical protein
MAAHLTIPAPAVNNLKSPVRFNLKQTDGTTSARSGLVIARQSRYWRRPQFFLD